MFRREFFMYTDLSIWGLKGDFILFVFGLVRQKGTSVDLRFYKCG